MKFLRNLLASILGSLVAFMIIVGMFFIFMALVGNVDDGVVVKKKENITYLSEKYNADLFVYVTEFDIENDMSDPTAFVNGDYKRLLKLHFSMVNKEGEIIEKGLISIPFPNDQNNIYKIRTLYLPMAAKKMMDRLPYTPKPMVDDKKGKAVNASDKVRR